MEQRFYTVKEVAAFLRVSKSQVYYMIQRGQIPAYKISERRMVISVMDLYNFVKKLKPYSAIWWNIFSEDYWKVIGKEVDEYYEE